MKKQIVINASKDRSRIAIVEDGELAELYVENPDNVRTIGNIYLGRVQKVMPAIRAAFVDVGQKQDCFLHFSDLTDNFPQLLAMTGEEVPGLDEPVLSLAPPKRVATDESEPDPEEKLEVESGEEEDKPKSRRGRGRRSRGRGRGRGRGNRSEEEEEQEEAGEGRPKPLPSVIDLTSPPRRRPPRAPEAARPADDAPPPAPEADAPEADAPKADAPEAEAPPKNRRSRRPAKEAPETDASETDGTPPADERPTPADASEDGSETPKRKRRRRRRGGRGRNRRSTTDEAQTPDDARGGAAEPPEAPDAPDAPEADAPAEEDAPTVSVSPTGRSRKKLPSSIDLTSSAGAADPEPADEDTDGDGRSRRRSRKPAPETEAASESGPSEATDGSRRSRRGRSRKDAGDAESPSAEATENESKDRPSKDRPSRRGGRSKGDDRSDAKGDGGKGRGKGSNGRSASKSSSGRTASGGRGPIPPNEQLLRRDGPILVKITKEPISTKGPRVSTDLSLAGRFLVLVPAADYVAVSKKIESAKERRRLRTLATSLKPDGFGVIVRTVAEGRDAKSLDTDLRLLVEKWRKIEKKLAQKPNPPVLLYEDVNMVSSIIRDLFSEDYDRILVDDPKVFRNVQAYVKAVAPQMADKVEMHKGRSPVFRSVGIEKQVEEAFSKRVNMRGGGYLYIETTEAMHVIDVNSGRAGRGKSQKENLIAVNVEAAKEVAKQLRLRDLGGIIVVDFIDLKYDRDRKKVTDALKEAFKKDRAVTKLLPMSDFGLVQITRQRLRPSITTQGTDDDGEPLDPAEAAAAAGAGEIPQSSRRPEPEPEPETERRDEAPERAVAPEEATPQALAGRLRGWLDHYRRTVDDRYKSRPIVVRVHPLFGAYLRRGFPSPLTRWRLALRGITFHLEEDPGIDPLGFDVRDQKSGRSLLKKYAS